MRVQTLTLGLLVVWGWIVVGCWGSEDQGGAAAACGNDSIETHVVNEGDVMGFRNAMACANQRIASTTTIELKGDLTFSKQGSPPEGYPNWFALYVHPYKELTIRKSVASSAPSGRVKLAVSEEAAGVPFNGNSHLGLGIFGVSGGGSLTLENVTLQGGYQHGSQTNAMGGSALYILKATVTLRNCLVVNNTADYGAIAIAGSADKPGKLNLHNTIITGNRAVHSSRGVIVRQPSSAGLSSTTVSFSVSGETR